MRQVRHPQSLFPSCILHIKGSLNIAWYSCGKVNRKSHSGHPKIISNGQSFFSIFIGVKSMKPLYERIFTFTLHFGQGISNTLSFANVVLFCPDIDFIKRNLKGQYKKSAFEFILVFRIKKKKKVFPEVLSRKSEVRINLTP